MKNGIIKGIKLFNKKSKVLFSTPGNNRGKAYKNINKKYFKNILKYDLTELTGTDNLMSPKGIIKDTQEKLKKAYGAKKAFLLVNGSTSGIISSMFSLIKEDDIVGIEKNSHKSVYNALYLLKNKKVIIENEYDKKFNIPLGINDQDIIKKIKNKEIDVLVLTYPNYYGYAQNLTEISKTCKENGIKLIIDSAHGAHFGFNEKLPENALKYSDIVIVSAHKTLPSMTGGSFLLLNDTKYEKEIQKYLSIFVTSSPSYLIMSSLDFTADYLIDKAKDDYEKLIKKIEKLKKRLENNKNINIFKSENQDKTRLVLNFESDLVSRSVNRFLIENGIHLEMCENENLVAIINPFHTKKEMNILVKTLKKYFDENIFKTEIEINKKNINKELKKDKKQILDLDLDNENINIENSEGRISVNNILVYPPGIPIIFSGEIITKEKIEKIQDLIKKDVNVVGIESNKIMVKK